jgi:hypothetical protein
LLVLYRVRWQIEVVFKRLKSILGLGQLRGKTRAALEATILAQLVGWALQASQAAQLRQCLRALGANASWLVSSWSVTTLSVEVLMQQLRGSWGAERVRACLPQLQRYLGSCLRQDRTHQESTARAWLARKPSARVVVCEAA